MGSVGRLEKFPWPDSQHPGFLFQPAENIRVRLDDRQKNFALDRIDSGGRSAVLAREHHLTENCAKPPASRDGSWVEFSWCDGRLSITTDRLGTIPVFWCWDGDTLLFSSRMTDLAAAQRKAPSPNIAAAREMIFFDYTTGNETLLEGVSLLPSASACTPQHDGTFATDKYWVPPAVEECRVEDIEPWVEEAMAVLSSAHNRHGFADSQGLALPVTAGLDSRCNLALQRHHLSKAHLFHCHDLGRVELPYARRITRELALPLNVYDSGPSMRHVTEEAVNLGPGDFNLGHWRLVGIARQLAANGVTSTIDGFFQDLLFKATFLREAQPEHQVGGKIAEARYKARKAGLGEKLADSLAERLYSECREGENGLDFSQRFYIENRSRRLVCNIVRLNRNYLCVRAPALDAQLMDYGLALPWQLRKDSYLYRRIIHRLDAKLAAIPYDKTGLPLLDPRRRSWKKQAARTLRPYLDRAWPGRPFLQVPEGNFARLARRDDVFRSLVGDLLARSEWLRDVLADDHPARMLISGNRMGQAAVDCLGGMLTVAKLELAAAWTEKGRGS